ncbi:MAG: hypothetical protein RBS68_07410 [Anaerolineales bacterium]|nr:hypothetical protein [Anaerolineales bacterium]
MDRNRILTLAWLPFLLLFLGSCQRSASSPPPLPASTLESSPPAPRMISFPLALASTWIYDYRAHVEEQQAAWTVTETILGTQKRAGLLVAEVERIVSLREGQPDDPLFMSPAANTSWYILNGPNLFRQYQTLAPEDTSQNTELVLVFPPESVPCWPVNAGLGPQEVGASGCRYLSESLPFYETPAGYFENCVELLTPYLSGSIRSVFCANIGLVAEKYEHLGSPFGYELILIGYSLHAQ